MKLTIKQAVEKLDGVVSAKTLYQAVELKRLAHYRVSGSGKRGKVLIEETDLLAWIEAQKVGVEGRPSVPPRPKLKHLSPS